MAICRHLCLVLMCSQLAFAEFDKKAAPHQQHQHQKTSHKHHKATVRREEKVQRHEIGSAGSVQTHHKSAVQSKARSKPASTPAAAPVVMTSGSPVKIKNRHDSNQYLAACKTCAGVVGNATHHTLPNSCPGVLGDDEGCGFTAISTKGGEFEIVKVGAANGMVIHNNDLVVLKSKPNANTDLSAGTDYGYLGVCGQASKYECASAASFVRIFKGNNTDGTTDDILKHATMFIIAKEGGAEGAINLGDYVSFFKAFSLDGAGLVEEGSGAALSSCGAGSTTGACGASLNLYTVNIGSLSTQDELFKGQWQVEASGTQHTAITPPSAAPQAPPPSTDSGTDMIMR